ncbi:unnamed protein product [Ambrosiozyma monospora]|uniref:Unnamed protein product n=1 Tax=Ambrosiozyma monospora TaxID=43982 RepID=A0ACB5SRP1_AMBMO|nr:unnamed protein product [Ambrosiozyma monospora]
MNDSEFRNSPRSFSDDPSECKFNFSYFIRKKAALERAERIRNERNSVSPNELTIEYLSTRPHAWTEPALEGPNDEFVVKVFAPRCLYYDTLFQYVERWFFIVDSRYTFDVNLSSLSANAVHNITHYYPTDEFKDILTTVDDRFTKAPLELEHLQHVHKLLNNAKEYDPMVHEKWKTIYPLADEQWASFFKKLGTARIVMRSFVECYYQLQVGLLNKCFKSYCPRCSNVKDAVPSGIQHGLFECTAVDRLWT